MTDMYDLQRFVEAQRPIFDQVMAELRDGQKRTHWMWFVFPQIGGLGRSEMAVRYAISSQAEAEAYLRHPVLGPRLRECARLVTAVNGRTIRQILGSPDDMKFHSSMTLFRNATDDNQEFSAALAKYFAGSEDQRTLDLLRSHRPLSGP